MVLLMLAAIDKIDRNIDRVVVEYSLSKGLYCNLMETSDLTKSL